MFRIKHIFLAVLSLSSLCACGGRYGYAPDQEKMLGALDATIDNLDSYREAKVLKINDIKMQRGG